MKVFVFLQPPAALKWAGWVS